MFHFLLDFKNPYITPTAKEIRNWFKRTKFSKYLPYLAYDPEREIYVNKDDTHSFIFKCTPRAFADEELKKNIAALLELLTAESILSVTLMSSPYIKPYISAYKQLKKRASSNILLKKTINKHAQFLEKGTEGLPHTLGVPIRDFQLFVAFKTKNKNVDSLEEIKSTVYETLQGSYLNPSVLEPDELLRILSLLFNGEINENITWDAEKPLADQVIKTDTKIRVKNDHLEIGDRYFYCVTPKHIAPEISLESIGNVVGGSRGAVDDSNQIPAHFIFTTLYAHNSSTANLLRSKAALFKRQAEGEDSILARTIGRYAKEHLDAVDNIEKGQKYYYAMPIYWVWNRDKKKAINATERLKRLMSRQGIAPQQEISILSPMFLAALPFGMYNEKNTFQQMERFFLGTERQSACLAPVVADYKGGGDPHLFFVSRKGQLIPFDPFDKTSPNKNLCVMGTTGGGKSFTLNLYALSMFSSGAFIRIFDLGYSYQKLCKILGGYYIDPGKRKICLNPFSFVPNTDDPKEIQYYLDSIAAMAGIMAFSDTEEQVSQTQKNLLKGATRFAWNEYGPEAGITHMFQYLAKFPQYAGEEIDELCNSPESDCRKDLAQIAHHLAFNLTNWTANGSFSEWFNGPANVDLLNAPLIVFELEKLRRVPALLKVVSLASMNATTAVMYHMPRDLRKVVIYEECGVTLQRNELFQVVVEEAYRRGRKNNVSTTTVFQSPLDLKKLGTVGEVILANAAYHLYLPSPDYPKAIQEKILPHEGFEHYLASLDSVRPRYSEVGLQTPYGLGVGRVIVDSFSYWIATSDPEDWTLLQQRATQHEEKRSHIRIQIDGVMKILQLGGKGLPLINLSKEGCFLNTREPLPVNARVDFEFISTFCEFKGYGKVVHSGPDGMGIVFEALTEGETDLFDMLSKEEKFQTARVSPDSLVSAIEMLEEERDRKMFGIGNGDSLV